MDYNNLEQQLLSNKYLFLKRNSSSLLSTSSSLRGKKLKLRNEFSPFSKLERRTSNNKNLLDFPICISIFANNISINENDINININQKPKLHLKFADINNNSIKFNKKIKTRNHNSFLLGSLSPKNSSKQINISNFSKLPPSSMKKESKPLNNKINKLNYMPLFKFTQQNFLKKNKKNEIITSFEQDLSGISPKNPPINANNTNTNSNKSKIIFTSQRTSISSQQDNISKKNNWKKESIKNRNSNTKNTIIKGFNTIFNENEFKKKEIFLSDKNINNNNNGNDKITDNLLLNNNKEKNGNIPIIKNNKLTIDINNITLENKRNSNNNKEEVTTKIEKKEKSEKTIYLKVIKKEKKRGIISDKNILGKIKKNKISLALCNKKDNDIYKKNKFLNKIFQKSINNSSSNINSFIQKSEILIDFKEETDKLINNIKINYSLNTKQDLDSFNLNYLNDLNVSINNNKENNNSYDYIKIKFDKINKYILFNCKLCYSLNKYITNSNEFDSLSISLYNNKPIFNKKNNFNQKRNIYFRKLNSKEHFLQTKSSFGRYYGLNIYNLININDIFLKSLPFYNIKPKLKLQKNIGHPKFKRQVSKALKYKSSNSIILLKALNQKNINNNSDKKEKEKDLIKKSTFLIQEFIKNSKYPKFHKIIPNINQYSILNKKNFFKQDKSTMIDKTNKNNDKEDELNKINDIDEIYLELIKLIIEGKSKSFINYFEKNKDLIDINQELFDGNSLLILSTREGNFAITKYLCEHGSEINNQNYRGNTALHYAIGKKFFEIVDILTKYGAREDIKNNKGLTPWECMEHKINFKY